MFRKNSGRVDRKLFSVVIFVENEKARDFTFYFIYFFVLFRFLQCVYKTATIKKGR